MVQLEIERKFLLLPCSAKRLLNTLDIPYKKEALELAEREKQEAIEQAKREEQDRVIQEKLKADIKAKNYAHQKKINREALDSFVAEGFEEKQAKALITTIAMGNIKHISINY